MARAGGEKGSISGLNNCIDGSIVYCDMVDFGEYVWRNFKEFI